MPARLPAREDVHALLRAALPGTTINQDGAARLLVLLDETPPPQLARVDEYFRDGHGLWFHLPDFWSWGQPTPAWRSQLLGWLDTHEAELLSAPGLLGAFAGHQDGHVREAATRRLAQVDHPIATGLLMVRIRDWVPPVRDVAREALHARLHPGFVHHWVRWTALVDHLEVVARGDAALVERVRALLRTPAGQGAMREVLPHADLPTRAGFLTVVEGLPEIEREAWLEEFARDTHAALRRRVVPLASHTRLRSFLSDPDVVVREKALSRLLDEPRGVPDFLREALLDPRTGVRSIAQFEARQRGVEVREAYLALNEHNLPVDTLRGWIGGLREVGDATVTPRLRALLTHTNVRVREAALRTVGTLAPKEHEAALEAALLRSGREAGAAASALRTANLVTPALLSRVWPGASTEYQRRRLVQLALRLARFDAAILLLGWRSDATPELRIRIDEGVMALLSGFGRTFYTLPNAAQRAAFGRWVDDRAQDARVRTILRELLA